MVARHVAALEAHLGTSLIARTTRRQTLTDIGRSYYERCRVVLAEIAEADAVAQEMKATPSGIIRVNAPVTLVHMRSQPLLPTILPATLTFRLN